MKYKNIKNVLRHHIKNGIRSLWTWNNNEFRCIYDNYTGDDRIYTASQLLKKLENEITK